MITQTGSIRNFGPKHMKNIEKYMALCMLLFAIVFNLWIYRLEPTAKTDPNDNTFQFALVDRTNQIWDFALKNCSSQKEGSHPAWGWKDAILPFCHLSSLADHWVPNWAEGYNLPYYYSHLPQIAIVASWKLFSIISQYLNISISLFQYYHVIIYLLLSFFPLSVFVALRVIRLPWLTAGFGALIATHVSTDGLYGLDPPSFLWRGYGLSSQLFAMISLPLAIAYAWRFFQNNESRIMLPVFFLAATTTGHLGIGIIAFLSVGIFTLSQILATCFISLKNPLKSSTCINSVNDRKNILIEQSKKLLMLYGGVLLLLGYWIIPALLDNNFHNISVWDPIWKFNSYGAGEILKNLFNGDLFDFGRLPILTLLTFIGFFAALGKDAGRHAFLRLATLFGIRADRGNGERLGRDTQNAVPTSAYFPFAFLFIFWLLMYFGRTTWGGLIDLVPGIKEFHLSRFIVGVQLAGLFLAPIGINELLKLGTKCLGLLKLPYKLSFVVLVGFVVLSVYPQTIRYASHNDVLIRQANDNYQKVESDVDELLQTLHALQASQPGRVFAGRGGSWGRDFRVAETPYYLHLSTYGIPTVLWLPQTWSPNSDTEQYFSENRPEDYVLYNIRYVVTPNGEPASPAGRLVEPQPFWKPLKESPSWKLYEVTNVIPAGYITTGVRPAIVSSSKENFLNVVRLWIQSDFPKQGLYPQLTFNKDFPRNTGLPNFRMLDEVTYKVPDGSMHNLFSEIPNYQLPSASSQLPVIISQESTQDMIFKAKVEVKENCKECIIILKQTFHPSWRVTIDAKRVKPFTVFPFFTAIEIREGTHDVVFSYQHFLLKQALLLISILSLTALGILKILRQKQTRVLTNNEKHAKLNVL